MSFREDAVSEMIAYVTLTLGIVFLTMFIHTCIEGLSESPEKGEKWFHHRLDRTHMSSEVR